ncbi:hypothetical protein B9Z55_021376 [Caenorhabditis nigoni]|nr:hypothetical protein B9Z55_021376 [Caenorhabditis nigoni]
MAIFKKIWMRWRKFEKWLISVDTFGHKVYKENVIVCSNYNAANLNKVQIDYSNITDRSNDEMNQKKSSERIHFLGYSESNYGECKGKLQNH